MLTGSVPFRYRRSSTVRRVRGPSRRRPAPFERLRRRSEESVGHGRSSERKPRRAVTLERTERDESHRERRRGIPAARRAVAAPRHLFRFT